MVGSLTFFFILVLTLCAEKGVLFAVGVEADEFGLVFVWAAGERDLHYYLLDIKNKKYDNLKILVVLIKFIFIYKHHFDSFKYLLRLRIL